MKRLIVRLSTSPANGLCEIVLPISQPTRISAAKFCDALALALIVKTAHKVSRGTARQPSS
jgi:hypothetical protein